MSGNSLFKTLISSLFFLVFSLSLKAAIIELTNGEKINGIITTKNDDYIDISVGANVLQIHKNDIKAIKGRPAKSKNHQSSAKENKDSSFNRGISLASLGNFDKAKAIFENLRNKYPNEQQIQAAYQICLDIETKEISHDYARNLFKGADNLLKGNYLDSIGYFQEVLRINPKAHEAYYNIASAYQAINKPMNAIPYYKELLKLNPKDKEVILNMAIAYYSIKEYRESILYLEKAADLMPTEAKIYIMLSKAYKEIGNTEKADYLLNKLLILDKSVNQENSD